MRHPLRTLVASALQIIDIDECYIHPPKNGTAASTFTKVLELFEKGPPTLDEDFYRLADEIILFFQELPSKPEYAGIMERPDSGMYQSCIDVANEAEVLPMNVIFAVQMPNVYGRLKPRKPDSDINVPEAVVTQPGSFMGKHNVPDRFFVKLVAVGDYDRKYGGNCFELRDRNNNIGFFYERAENMRGKLSLGDCFAMYGTPTRHASTDSGEKHTIFRSIKIIENKGPGSGSVAVSNDATGLFTSVS